MACFPLPPLSVLNGIMKLQTIFIVCFLLTMSAAKHKAAGGNTEDKRGKFFGIFNIVSFPNDVCNGTNDMQGEEFRFSQVL